MEEPEEIVVQKRQAAIKLAKNLEPFNFALGEEFDAIYIETLTEDMKQCAREIKKLARVVAVFDQTQSEALVNLKLPMTVQVDEEEERVTKLMRRYSTRIQKMADLIYEVAYLDFEGLQQGEIAKMMELEEGEEDDDE